MESNKGFFRDTFLFGRSTPNLLPVFADGFINPLIEVSLIKDGMTITNIRNLDNVMTQRYRREHIGFLGAYWKGKVIPKRTGGMSYAMQRHFFSGSKNVIVWEPESVFMCMELPLLLSQSPLFATATGEENQYVHIYIYIYVYNQISYLTWVWRLNHFQKKRIKLFKIRLSK